MGLNSTRRSGGKLSNTNEIVEAVKKSDAELLGKGYRVWTKDDVLASFEKYDRHSFVRVIGVIYDRQTASEKSGKHTNTENGMGFSRYDAEFLSSLYEKGVRFGGLTDRQFEAAKKAMRKYAGQLAAVKNERSAREWEAAREREAKAEDEAFAKAYPEKAADLCGREPDMCRACGTDCYGDFCSPACIEYAEAADQAKSLSADGVPDALCLMCDNPADGDKFCSSECHREYMIDNYEGPDAESIALSRAYASAF